MQVGVLPEDLHRGLGRADGAVAAQAVEDRLHRARRHDEVGVRVDAGVGDVVDDADGHVRPASVGRQLVEQALHVRRGELLGAEAVAGTDDPGDPLTIAGGLGLDEGPDHVEVQGLAHRARFLGAVEDG